MTDPDADQLLNSLAQALLDKRATNILALDVRDVSTMTDYFLIAEGNVERHVKALGDVVLATLDTWGQEPAYVEGQSVCDWLVIDCWNVVVHLFTPAMRQRYQLERLWQEGKVVDLDLDLSKVETEVDVI